MNFLNWISLRTAGRVVGNHAYISSRKQTEVAEIAAELAKAFEDYQKWGGRLDVESWLKEKATNNAVSNEELAVRYTYLKFEARRLNTDDLAMLLETQLNLSDVRFAEFNTFRSHRVGNDFLDDEKLYELWEVFVQTLHSDGLSDEDSFQQAFLHLIISPERLKRFANYVFRRLGLPPPA